MITVVGLGFVGLTTALGFSHFGQRVYGIETNLDRLRILNNNEIPFFEPHLDEAIRKFNGNLFILDQSLETAVKNSEYIFFCVGTPYGEEGKADLSHLLIALESTLKHLERPANEKKVIIIKSTVPPSSTKNVIIPFIESQGFENGKDILVVCNPEFLREGYCWEDFIKSDRIVIGYEHEEALDKITKIYEAFNAPVYGVSYNSGEFIKYLSNTFLATMISYSNEMSLLADAIGGIEISKAFKILHEDKRWGNGSMSSYVFPGCGYGGYCLPKDTNALSSIGKENGYKTRILDEVIQLNNEMPENVIKKIISKCEKNRTLGILGLSFKPGSNDVRESVASKVIRRLLKEGYSGLLAYDPLANKEFEETYHFDIQYRDSLELMKEQADYLIILTAWDEFKSIDPHKYKVLDFRYIL